MVSVRQPEGGLCPVLGYLIIGSGLQGLMLDAGGFADYSVGGSTPEQVLNPATQWACSHAVHLGDLPLRHSVKQFFSVHSPISPKQSAQAVE